MHVFASRSRTARPAVSPSLSKAKRADRACSYQGLLASKLQGKLEVGAANDHYERQANGVADRVLHSPVPGPRPNLSRAPDHSYPHAEQTQSGETDQEHSNTASLATPVGIGRALPSSLRSFFEPRFNHDFDAVRLHTDSHAASSASRIAARAYTFGNHIVFGEGQYQPATLEGCRLIAHELTHTIQQAGCANGENKPFGRALEGGPNVKVATTRPVVQMQQQTCDLLHTFDVYTSEAIANVWNIKVISWLNHLESQVTRFAESAEFTPGALAEEIYQKMQLLNRHFNLASFLKQQYMTYPASAADLSVEMALPLRELLKELRGRFEGLNFFLSFDCLASCDKEGEGGHAVPGSGEFSICLDVYDCQEENSKAYIVFHEIVHATYSESDFDIYITDPGYPGNYPRSIRNPDSLANFAAALNAGKEFAVSICMPERGVL